MYHASIHEAKQLHDDGQPSATNHSKDMRETPAKIDDSDLALVQWSLAYMLE